MVTTDIFSQKWENIWGLEPMPGVLFTILHRISQQYLRLVSYLKNSDQKVSFRAFYLTFAWARVYRVWCRVRRLVRWKMKSSRALESFHVLGREPGHNSSKRTLQEKTMLLFVLSPRKCLVHLTSVVDNQEVAIRVFGFGWRVGLVSLGRVYWQPSSRRQSMNRLPCQIPA